MVSNKLQCCTRLLAIASGKYTRYIAVMCLIIVAALLRIWPLGELGPILVWLTFYPAVMISAIIGGFSAGLFGITLTCLIALFCGPFLVGQHFIISRADWIGMAVFIFNGLMISAVAEAMRRAHQRAKLAQEAAENANKAKSVFLANMSHELRTPLNAILGFSSLISKDPELPPVHQRNIEIINKSGEHLLNLINDVLDMAKIDAGKVQIEELPFDLGSMIRDVTDMMSLRAKDKGLRLILDQSSEFPRYIIGDEAHLRQILINLIGNAIKFTPQGGIALRLGTQKNLRSHLKIEIEDTGVGIDSKDKARVFEPFVQIIDQGQSKGTGLGLTITKQLIEQMGGSITLESVLGKGSLFRIDLPIRETLERDLVLQTSIKRGALLGIEPGQPAIRVLIIEDQLENQLLLTQLMNDIGIESKIANDGLQGVELYKTWKPHLIWMDRRMSHMDGVEATKAIRALPDGQAVKIVAVTASAFKEQREEMIRVGMNDFIRKPYRSDEIYECLERNLGIKFIYEDQGVPDGDDNGLLTAEMMTSLPEEIRVELKAALESLRSDRIKKILDEVALINPSIHKALKQRVDNFDYPAIIKLLLPREVTRPCQKD